MKLVVALSWYAEPPKFLHRCVSSVAPIADRIVCYDGAWDLFPGATAESSREEYAAIRDAAETVGLAYEIFTPDTEWASQVEKRAALMADAAQHGDWLMVIDGDEYVADAKPYELRAHLDRTDLDVATVECVRTTGVEAVNIPGRIRRIYRAACGVTVDTAHNGYRTADGRWLHGDSAAVRLEPALDCSGFVRLHHERANRGDDRNRRALMYRSERLRLQAEDWRRRMPGGVR